VQFFKQALGIDYPWEVKEVKLDQGANKVEIWIQAVKGVIWRDEDGERLHVAGYEQRSWRHLDTMQFETVLHARVPRVKNSDGSTSMVQVPWAERYSRWSRQFECWAIVVMQATSTVQAACKLLGIDWHTAHAIMERAVERGLASRDEEVIEYVGMDEKSFMSGQSYISTMNDLQGGRVLEVVEGHNRPAADALWDELSERQVQGVKAVAMDMSKSFMGSANEKASHAAIVHDRFHVSKYLNDAVNAVRIEEHKALSEEGDSRLKGVKSILLMNPENLDEGVWNRFDELRDSNLKVSRAWHYKDLFRSFWECANREAAQEFFNGWYRSAVRCHMQPIKKVARMLKEHLPGLLNFAEHRITNALSESLNSRIQSIKTAARGFRCFENYRIRILFFLGKLDLLPTGWKSHGIIR